MREGPQTFCSLECDLPQPPPTSPPTPTNQPLDLAAHLWTGRRERPNMPYRPVPLSQSPERLCFSPPKSPPPAPRAGGKPWEGFPQCISSEQVRRKRSVMLSSSVVNNSWGSDWGAPVRVSFPRHMGKIRLKLSYLIGMCWISQLYNISIEKQTINPVHACYIIHHSYTFRCWNLFGCLAELHIYYLNL